MDSDVFAGDCNDTFGRVVCVSCTSVDLPLDTFFVAFVASSLFIIMGPPPLLISHNDLRSTMIILSLRSYHAVRRSIALCS